MSVSAASGTSPLVCSSRCWIVIVLKRGSVGATCVGVWSVRMSCIRSESLSWLFSISW
jgi:hypothetical protein